MFTDFSSYFFMIWLLYKLKIVYCTKSLEYSKVKSNYHNLLKPIYHSFEQLYCELGIGIKEGIDCVVYIFSETYVRL